MAGPQVSDPSLSKAVALLSKAIKKTHVDTKSVEPLLAPPDVLWYVHAVCIFVQIIFHIHFCNENYC
jgi:hypothetical protein